MAAPKITMTYGGMPPPSFFITLSRLFLCEWLCPEPCDRRAPQWGQNLAFVFAGLPHLLQKFDCSCGTCGDLSLDTCTCPTAVKEREFIRKSVEEGIGSDQIIAAVNKTYGHKKSETNLVVPPLSGFDGSARINTNSGEN